MRGNLIDAVASVGRDPALTAEAVELAENWRDLPPAIRGEVIGLAAHASPAVFERLRNEVYTEPDRAHRDEILNALASTREVKQQQAALALILDPRIDIRDTQFMLFGANAEANRGVSQQFFQDHKDAILARLPADSTTAGQTWLAYVFTSSCVPARRDEIAAYVTTELAKLPGGERAVKQAIEGMDQCIARRTLVEPELRSWLSGAPPAEARPGERGHGRASRSSSARLRSTPQR